jgi:hypothetical protein
MKYKRQFMNKEGLGNYLLNNLAVSNSGYTAVLLVLLPLSCRTLALDKKP